MPDLVVYCHYLPVSAPKLRRFQFEFLCRYIARLATLVPRPRVNLTRNHGVFAPPHSKYRALVTPAMRGGTRARTADDPETVELLRTDDIALLQLGFGWLKNVLFNEQTINMKAEVLQAAIARARMELGAT